MPGFRTGEWINGDRGKGLFRNSTLHNNLIVDSAWMGLLQVNKADLENIHFYSNTLIRRPGSLNAGILWIIFTSAPSGMSGGWLVPGTVHPTNNLFVPHNIYRPWSWLPLIDPAGVYFRYGEIGVDGERCVEVGRKIF
jgi:hypothetical protein